MDRQYSNAFELLVKGENEETDDITGLLAYAFYKRDKRARALAIGSDAPEIRNHHTILTPGLVEQYRETALRRLEAYAKSAIEQVEPEIQKNAQQAELQAVKSEIVAKIESKASPWQSILWNVVAWLISLAITFLIAVGFGRLSLTINPS